jgi:hypothetical protein
MWATDTQVTFKSLFEVPAILKSGEVGLLAQQMYDLYTDCLRQVVADENVRFHVAIMPSLTSRQIHTVRGEQDEDFATDIAAILNTEIADNDCIILLDTEILSVGRNEDEMLEKVLFDVGLHLQRVFPVEDGASGWVGHYIGAAAICSVIASAHDVLKMLSPAETLINRIKDEAQNGVLNDFRVIDRAIDAKRNRPALEAIEEVCDRSLATHGGYLTLPATCYQIAQTAKQLFHEIVDTVELVRD